MSEAVNHPKHYQKQGRKECIDEMEFRFGCYATCIFAILSAYKYLYRAGEKDGNSKQQDIEKAKWYIDYAENGRLDMCYGIERAYIKKIIEYIKEELKNAES